MGLTTRYCHDCGQDQVFDQPHPGRCPDAPDGGCLEWACTGCGAALFAGFPGLLAGAGVLRAGRVA
jgi:hypothetical protein